MRLTTVLRRLLSVTQMYVKHVEVGRRRPVAGVGRAVVAAGPMWDLRPLGGRDMPPPQPGGVWAASVRGAG